LVSRFLIRRPQLERLVIGTPTLLLYDGRVLYDRLKREHVSVDELCEVMHVHGLTKFEEVGMAVLELDGSISIVPAGHSCKFDDSAAVQKKSPEGGSARPEEPS